MQLLRKVLLEDAGRPPPPFLGPLLLPVPLCDLRFPDL